MKKLLLSTILLGILFGFVGCATSGGLLGVKNNGIVKKLYNPLYIDKDEDSKLAYIKAAENLIIVTVNGDRKTPFYKVMIGQGIDSIKIKEGTHTIKGWLGIDINIGSTYYKAGHDYFIDYKRESVSRGTKISYWIKDLTDNKIVYGKEVK